MNPDKKFTRLVESAMAQSFTGWDFTYAKERIQEADTSWNYRELVEKKISHASALVDMCTGGGEFLDTFKKLPTLTYATEGFQPNISVAKKRLEKRGVKVVEVTADEKLPLPSQTFDLVINRHGAYSPKELLRIMRPSGASFLTQQVGSNNAAGINEVLRAPPPTYPNWRLDIAVGQLISLGFSVTRSEEEFPVMSFRDIGAVVFYLNAIPWQIPGFSVTTYQAELVALHHQIEANGSFDTQNHRFLVEANLS